MAAARPTVAAFDVDGTLTTRDCVTPFLWRTVRVRTALALVRHPRAVVRALARRDRDTLKEVVCTAFAGWDREALGVRGEEFALVIERRWLRGDTVARLRRHREIGHMAVLTSASLESYLLPLGELLGVDGVVCTRLEHDGEGRLTGRLEGRNCRGAEKARRFQAWLDEHGLADAIVWAYGDSSSDAELLERADHPVWVANVAVDPEPVA